MIKRLGFQPSARPVWSYKYKITYPDGETFEAGPHGFYTAVYAYFNINTSRYTNGTWKID